MISMRYGGIPVVANTGGLHDSVKPAAAVGHGFLFQPGNAAAFLSTLLEALDCYKDAPLWAALQRRAMSEDFLGKSPSKPTGIFIVAL